MKQFRLDSIDLSQPASLPSFPKTKRKYRLQAFDKKAKKEVEDHSDPFRPRDTSVPLKKVA